MLLAWTHTLKRKLVLSGARHFVIGRDIGEGRNVQ